MFSAERPSAAPDRPAPRARPGAWLSRRLEFLAPTANCLPSWRDKLLNGLCAVAFVLGLLIVVPSVLYSTQEHHWWLIASDIAALACIGALHLLRQAAFRLRAAAFLAVCYLLAVVLLFSVGPLSQPYLLAVPVLCNVLLGSRPAVAALLWCSATLFAAGYAGGIDPGLASLDVSVLMHWSLVALNFLLVAAVLVVSCAYLLHGLERALARQRAVHEALQEQVAALQARDLELRESLAARKAAEESNELKSAFLAMISHEVRTPLGGVIGMLQLAKKDASLSAGTRDKLRIGLGNAEVLLHIINDILDFSRLEAGKMPFEEADFDLPALLYDVVALLADRAAGKGIALVAEIDPALPRWWRADPVRLRQVVMNLVGNGVKFTERGEVRLLAYTARHGELVMSVRDSGIGIEPGAIARLFQKFEQGNAATARKYGGAGLGLAICKSIVDTMGGRIDVRSEPGVGSVFEVVLPLRQGQPAAVPHAPPAAAPHAVRLEILCAEDGATNQVILREMLAAMGHVATIAEDGAAALAQLAQRDFDLVIMDSRMPRMDGIEALRLLRSGAMGVRQPAVPVIALTANAAEQERQRFLDAGANAFLPKPIDEARLQAEVGRQAELLLARAPQRIDLEALFRPQHGAAGMPPEAQANAAARTAFRLEAPRLLGAIRQGLAAGDAGAVGLHAHRLLGSAGYFDAGQLAALCRRIEALADAGQLSEAAPLAGALEDALKAALAQPATASPPRRRAS